MFLPYSNGNFGEVQPNTYPPDLGFYCGITMFVNPFYINFCFPKYNELLN